MDFLPRSTLLHVPQRCCFKGSMLSDLRSARLGIAAVRDFMTMVNENCLVGENKKKGVSQSNPPKKYQTICKDRAWGIALCVLVC